MSTEAKTKKTLSRAEAFRMADYIRSRWNYVQEHKVDVHQFTEEVKKNLKLDVTYIMVRACAKDLGLQFPYKARIPGSDPGRDPRSRRNYDRIKLLAKIVRDLLQKFDEPVPEELNAIINASSMPQSGEYVNGSH